MTQTRKSRMGNAPRSLGRSVAGFSLVEVMVVMAIAAVMFALLGPAVSALVGSNAITQSGQVLNDQIVIARQLASTRNEPVEVRVIRLRYRGGATAQYRAVQIWSTTTPPKPLGRAAVFAGSVVLDDGSGYSPFLDVMAASGFTGTMDRPVDSQPSAPYVAFRIRPDGAVEPDVATGARNDVCLTLIDGLRPVAQARQNYATVQISPYTARTTVIRP